MTTEPSPFEPIQSRRAFSFVDLVLTTTVTLLLAGVVSPRSADSTDEARSARIVALTLHLAGCGGGPSHEDTGELPREFSGYQGSAFHRLAKNPGIAGWGGPYIEAPIDPWPGDPAGGLGCTSTRPHNMR